MRLIENAALEFFMEHPFVGKAQFAEWLADGWEGKSNYLRQCYERVAYDAISKLKREGRLKICTGARYRVMKEEKV